MDEHQDHPHLYDVPQAAVIFGKGQRWVRDRVADRTLDHVRIGKSIRFTKQQLDAFIDANTRRGVQAATAGGWGRKRRRTA